MSSSEITPKQLYVRRREFLKLGAGSALALSLPAFAKAKVEHGAKLAGVTANPKYALAEEKKNAYEDITTYNNFYELGTDKSDPSENASKLQTRPWTVSVEGEVGKPRKWDIEEILKSFPIEERVYRLRCVEAWSMVIPWDGFPLADFLKKHDPTSRAKYVAFESAVQPQMPGVKGYAGIPFPYLEGLRIDEATHPLALLVVGLYGEALPAAESEAPLPALCGRDGERQQQQPGAHSEKDELVLEDVLRDGANVEALIDHRVGEQMQAGVEEAEVAEELADPDRPVPTEQDLRRGTGEREREQHERDVPEVVEERLDGVGPQARGDELDGEPERGHAARGERSGDQRLLQ